MRIIEEEQLDFSDVLIRPARSDFNSRSEANIFRTFKKSGYDGECWSREFSCIPICIANMNSIATPEMAKIAVRKGLLCAMEKHLSYNELRQMYDDLTKMEIEDECDISKFVYTNRIALSIGVSESLDTIKRLNDEFSVNIINIDVANGYMSKLQDRVREVREAFPYAWIIAGTVVTGDIVTDLLNCGADIIRAGIGAGAQCRTRLQTGVGRPMVSMLQECSDAAHQIHGYVMSDGGCTCPGDICKALGCADFVMVGSMFAGAEEAAEDIVEIDGERYKKFAGMSSAYVQNKLFGGFKSQYRSSEGRQTLVKIAGPLSDIIDDILGGLRSCFTYIGCHNMKHFQKHCVFYKVRHQLTTTYEHAPTFKQ